MPSDPILFPPSEPRETRYVDVGDGHRLWVEDCGAAAGLPVLFLHGGPGSGCSPAQRRLFDPARFRAILVDQRGAGRSEPLGSLDGNTAPRLVADLEQLRRTLGIARWIVFGGSWGSLLALRYAQAHPEQVLGLVLRGIFLGSAGEIDAYVRGACAASPGAWASFGDSSASPRERLDAFAETILSGRPDHAVAAMRSWLDHERRLMGEGPLDGPPDAARQAKVRIQMHYLRAGCFVEEGALLAGVERIRHLPAAIVQGLADPVCPPRTALRLREVWPEADWIPVPGGGHSGMADAIAAACIGALSAVASRCGWQAAEGIPSGRDK